MDTTPSFHACDAMRLAGNADGHPPPELLGICFDHTEEGMARARASIPVAHVLRMKAGDSYLILLWCRGRVLRFGPRV